MNPTMDLIWASLIAFGFSMLPVIKTYIITHFVLEKLFKYGARFIRFAYRKNLVFTVADHHYQNHNKKQSPIDCSKGHCQRIRHSRRKR